MIPDWAIPLLHFWSANVTSMVLVGVVVLACLYAVKSWQSGRRRRSFSAARVWWIAGGAALARSVPLLRGCRADTLDSTLRVRKLQ